MTDFTKHHVLVTGGGSGIGLAIAQALTKEGARVSLAGRSLDRLKKAARDISRSQFVVMDVASEKSVEASIAKLAKKSGPISILVNNAGAADSVPFEKTKTSMWQLMLDVNLTGAFYCTRAVLPAMKKLPAGRIINIASTAGLKGYAYTAAYVAAKHGLVGLTRALAVELAKTNITINAVCPGFTDTKMVGKAVNNIAGKSGRSESEILKSLTNFNPQNRLIKPEEVAAAVVWLVGENGRSVTGQSIVIAGGEIM